MEKEKIELKRVLVSSLKQHPKHKKIYGETAINQLKENISEFGMLQTIIVNPSMQILCGWRRFQAIQLLGWDELDVRIIDMPKDDEAAFMVNSNSQRQKTNVEIYNELKVLKEYWAKKQGTRTDLDEDMPEEEKEHTRSRIAEAIGVSETKIHKIEFIGDKDVKMLELVDTEEIGSINEAYTSCQLDKPKHEKGSVEIDLTKMRLCPCCECMPRRIVKDENGKLIYSIL
jgi:hypothetical protein